MFIIWQVGQCSGQMDEKEEEEVVETLTRDCAIKATADFINKTCSLN